MVEKVLGRQDEYNAIKDIEPIVNIRKLETEQIAIEILDPENFKEKAKTGIAFINFSASKCNKCKKLEPVWKALAEEYEGEFYISWTENIYF